MDNKHTQDGRDDAKVDINDFSEVEYLHQQWKQFSHEDIRKAIEQYGPLRKNIEEYLGKHAAAE